MTTSVAQNNRLRSVQVNMLADAMIDGFGNRALQVAEHFIHGAATDSEVALSWREVRTAISQRERSQQAPSDRSSL